MNLGEIIVIGENYGEHMPVSAQENNGTTFLTLKSVKYFRA